MGINELRLLDFARNSRDGGFGRTLTLGRQGFAISRRELQEETGHRVGEGEEFIERLLAEVYGSTTVDSLDLSPFEGASVAHDLNMEVPAHLVSAFDTVIDFGTLEHVFNVSQALRGTEEMCAPGGMVLHAVPSNGFCGHGMYQFSPEFFFSFYTENAGYDQFDLFLAEYGGRSFGKYWWHAERPEAGRRLEPNLSKRPMGILCAARRSLEERKTAERTIYQSDYEHSWSIFEGEAPAGSRYPRLKSALEKLGMLPLAEALYVKFVEACRRRQEKNLSRVRSKP